MPRYVAFLRAVNVGGRVVKMEELRALFEAMKFSRVDSFIASGNIIFESRAAEAELTEKIEARLHKALGYEVHTFVRSDAEVAAIAARRPFEAKAIETALSFCVALLAAPLTAEAQRALAALASDEDQFHLDGREIYWISRLKQSEAKVSNAVLERKLGVRMTLRGMSTMQKLTAKYPPLSGRELGSGG